MSEKPLLSLSLDLDNLWAYLKVRGAPDWESSPSYLPQIVPRILDFLRARNLTITVFVVGRDASAPENREALAAIAQAGHEIGNHGYSHEPWLNPHDASAQEREVASAEEAIVEAAGCPPIGYRSAGFSCSPALIRLLSARGYSYDASLFPTSVGALARRVYFASARLSPEEEARRRHLFGQPRAWSWTLRGFRWADGGRHGALEIPVTTLPFLRLPMHFSYTLALGGHSQAAARTYHSLALRVCRATGVTPSLLLHPLDFMGEEDVPRLRFFPGMKQPRAKKLECLERMFGAMEKHFHIAPLREQARLLESAARVPVVDVGALEARLAR